MPRVKIDYVVSFSSEDAVSYFITSMIIYIAFKPKDFKDYTI